MTALEVRPSVVADVYALAANLREGDAAEVAALGRDPREAIRRSYRNAILRRTYLVGGEVAAMSGLCGDLLSDRGEVFLMTGPGIERAKRDFIRAGHACVAEMLVHRALLEGYVAASYLRAHRFLQVLGFTISAPFPVGPNQAAFCRFSLQRG